MASDLFLHKYLYEEVGVRMSVEVALQEALDLLGPGLQTGHPAGLPVVDDRRPLVLTQRGEQVCQVGELRPALEVVG